MKARTTEDSSKDLTRGAYPYRSLCSASPLGFWRSTLLTAAPCVFVYIFRRLKGFFSRILRSNGDVLYRDFDIAEKWWKGLSKAVSSALRASHLRDSFNMVRWSSGFAGLSIPNQAPRDTRRLLCFHIVRKLHENAVADNQERNEDYLHESDVLVEEKMDVPPALKLPTQKELKQHILNICDSDRHNASRIVSAALSHTTWALNNAMPRVEAVIRLVDEELVEFTKARIFSSERRGVHHSDAFAVDARGRITAVDTPPPSPTLHQILVGALTSRKRKREGGSMDEAVRKKRAKREVEVVSMAKLLGGVISRCRSGGNAISGALVQTSVAKALNQSRTSSLSLDSLLSFSVSPDTANRLAMALSDQANLRREEHLFAESEAGTAFLSIYDNYNVLRWRHVIAAQTNFTRMTATLTTMRLPLKGKIRETRGRSVAPTSAQAFFAALDAVFSLGSATMLVDIPAVHDTGSTPRQSSFHSRTIPGQSSSIEDNKRVLMELCPPSGGPCLLMVDTEPALVFLHCILGEADGNLVGNVLCCPQTFHCEMKLLVELASTGNFFLGAMYALWKQNKFKTWYEAGVRNAVEEVEEAEEAQEELNDSLREMEDASSTCTSVTVSTKSIKVQYSRLQQTMIVLEEALRVALTLDPNCLDGLDQETKESLQQLSWVIQLFVDYTSGYAKPYLEALPIVAAMFAQRGRPNLTRWALSASALLHFANTNCPSAVVTLCKNCKACDDIHVEHRNSLISRALPHNTVLTTEHVSRANSSFHTRRDVGAAVRQLFGRNEQTGGATKIEAVRSRLLKEENVAAALQYLQKFVGKRIVDEDFCYRQFQESHPGFRSETAVSTTTIMTTGIVRSGWRSLSPHVKSLRKYARKVKAGKLFPESRLSRILQCLTGAELLAVARRYGVEESEHSKLREQLLCIARDRFAAEDASPSDACGGHVIQALMPANLPEDLKVKKTELVMRAVSLGVEGAEGFTVYVLQFKILLAAKILNW